RQRPRARPHQQRQHGLHRAAHAHPHRAGRPQAVQDRDAAPGLQLHLAPGQRAAGGRGLRRRAALPHHRLLLPPQLARPRLRQPPAQADLHVLPQQPEETGQRQRKENSSKKLIPTGMESRNKAVNYATQTTWTCYQNKTCTSCIYANINIYI
ncbi:hypothetical protein ANANG_G00179980, partial [Anguilla anguilla]